MKISIVMAYFNRRQLLLNTLKSIFQREYEHDIELIIVDDHSVENERLVSFKDDIKKTMEP